MKIVLLQLNTPSSFFYSSLHWPDGKIYLKEWYEETMEGYETNPDCVNSANTVLNFHHNFFARLSYFFCPASSLVNLYF